MKERIKRLFFNSTLRRWHFGTLLQELKISRERLNHFLKELQNEQFVHRIKPEGKMPYYIANRETAKFRVEKRLYGLKLLEKLFEHLNSCEGITTAILFGSFARGDWSKSSDIDLFIYGDDSQVQKGIFEAQLGREIQLFTYSDPREMKKQLDPAVIPNIAKGFHITESIEPFEVRVHV
ncbi:TPA: nucleotidyltransferase domain-containing protein [Candidatus Woesearchaeota archaeon]|nr:hypothetical protein [archaeon]HIJ10932.1 nucleotidyltransferase domain-containing protein [Candidatus Woesearchaeota archaeon]|tara:strand:- start:884 stop:1420 length:537 start_codon:yes stop_codon:yes gene_type:complete